VQQIELVGRMETYPLFHPVLAISPWDGQVGARDLGEPKKGGGKPTSDEVSKLYLCKSDSDLFTEMVYKCYIIRAGWCSQ
jgi:hypothetical protein